MALNAALTPLVISLLQASADAFVQSSVLTGLTGRNAYNVRSIYVEFPNAAAISSAISADQEISVAITRRSKTSMPNLSDSDVIHKVSFAAALVTSGFIWIPLVNIYTPPLEVPLVEETIYACLDSTGTAILNLAVVRLDVELDTMSDIDRLNLITRSLT
jgi:hypothetical protein